MYSLSLVAHTSYPTYSQHPVTNESTYSFRSPEDLDITRDMFNSNDSQGYLVRYKQPPRIPHYDKQIATILEHLNSMQTYMQSQNTAIM